MSAGAFLGIRGSYLPEFWSSADVFIQEINRALAERGLPAYRDSDTPPDPYRFSSEISNGIRRRFGVGR
jgi:hypothetical protein